MPEGSPTESEDANSGRRFPDRSVCLDDTSAKGLLAAADLWADSTTLTPNPRRSTKSTWIPPSIQELQRMLPQYEVQAFVARGGMGAVYRGIQKSLGRTVAIKILPPGLDDDGVRFAERFKREARAMASLSHPGIVSVYDAGETPEGLLYFVMEFIEGTDVGQLIANEGKIDPARAMAILAHACDALAFAHSGGIIHRDIKPSNLMIDPHGRVKVADFGLAKALNLESQGLTLSDMALGTPDFVAPEALVAGGEVDPRADVYAMGVMLYQMLTGEVPRGRFELPSRRFPRIDRRFDAIIDKAMQRDREKRYSSAMELRSDLDRIAPTPAAASSIVTVAPGRLTSSPNFALGRNQRLALVAGTSLAMLGALLVLGFKLNEHNQPPPQSNPNLPTWDPNMSRRVAEQALKLGATSLIVDQNGTRSAGGTLPAGDFRLVTISFPPNAATGQLKPADLPPLLEAQELEYLSLHSARKALNEEVCRRIAKLPHLRSLMLQYTNVQDAWLESIGSISSLEELTLAQNPVTDAGIAKLSELKHLWRLSVSETRVTGDAIARLPYAGSLREVIIGDPRRPADADVRTLIGAADSLERLLVKSKASAESLKDIGRLRRLREFGLQGIAVTAEHLRYLATLPQLSTLLLDGCQVSDEAWAALPMLKKLAKLQLLNGAARTPALEAALAQFHPPPVVEMASRTAANEPASDSNPPAPSPHFPPGQWVRPFQTAADIDAKWFTAGATWDEGWITPGLGFNNTITLAAPNGQAQNWGVRAKYRWKPGSTAMLLVSRSGSAAVNKMEAYQLRVTSNEAAFMRTTGRGTAAGSDWIPQGEPVPVNLQEDQEVIIEAFIIGGVLHARVNGQHFQVQCDGILESGNAEAASTIAPYRDIEFMNLDGLSDAEALSAAAL